MKNLWNGRLDSFEKIDLRFWQVIKDINAHIEDSNKKSFCFIGYDTDNGVIKNLGRGGAKEGPNAIRKAMQSFPIIEKVNLYDYKNLSVHTTEEAQEEYSNKMKKLLDMNIFPIGLGGGHDITYASYLGIRKAFPNKKIGIINFDAHLDIRPYDNGRTSGTSFKEILDTDKNVNYCIIGFQNCGNTKRLIDTANKYNTLILPEFLDEHEIIEKTNKFIENVDIVYVTFCMDVFDASIAPGVSAPTALGLDGKKGLNIFLSILDKKNTIALDFAEVNPTFDIDNRTSKLTARFIYEAINKLKTK